MTYKELYLKEHPWCDIDSVIRDHCPNVIVRDGDPRYMEFPECPGGSGSVKDDCPRCWDTEIPEYYEPKTGPADPEAASFQKTMYEFLADEPEKAKELWEKQYPFLRPDPVELKDIEVKQQPVTLDDIRKLGPSPVPVYSECPHYDERTETCRDHMDHERCVCGGDMLICDFFSEKREKAKQMVDSVDKAVNGPTIKDSGSRREFSTGAVRDIQEGKGRCDLMPLDVVAEYIRQRKSDRDYAVLYHIFCFVDENNTDYLHTALDFFANDHYDGEDYTMFLEVAKHFEAGAKKYSEDNWKKGIPVRCYIDSAVRHYLKFLRGDKDEAHDKAFVWNILCCIWTCKHKPELNDYRKEE